MNPRAVLFVILAGTSTLSMAQEQIFRATPGAKQLGITGNWMTANGADTYSVVLEGGFYLTDRLVAITRLGVTKQSPENRHILFGARYEFDARGATQPYLVAAVEFHDEARDQGSQIIAPPSNPRGTFFQAGAGLQFYTSTTSAAFVELVGFKMTGSNQIGTDLQIGLRVFFR